MWVAEEERGDGKKGNGLLWTRTNASITSAKTYLDQFVREHRPPQWRKRWKASPIFS